jgi:uncharacterized membrane protein (DUF373 family)
MNSRNMENEDRDLTPEEIKEFQRSISKMVDFYSNVLLWVFGVGFTIIILLMIYYKPMKGKTEKSIDKIETMNLFHDQIETNCIWFF